MRELELVLERAVGITDARVIDLDHVRRRRAAEREILALLARDGTGLRSVAEELDLPERLARAELHAAMAREEARWGGARAAARENGIGWGRWSHWRRERTGGEAPPSGAEESDVDDEGEETDERLSARIRAALKAANGNETRAALALRMSRGRFRRARRRLGLDEPVNRPGRPPGK